MTTTVPVEVILAAGCRPLDLNNLFITDDDPPSLIGAAERAGFPRNLCCWIKGIYGAIRKHSLRRVVGVVQGDCSNTHALMEVLQTEDVEVIEFAFPYARDGGQLATEISQFCSRLGTSPAQADAVRRALDPIRRRVQQLDRMTWHDHKVTGEENHIWQVNCSDFRGDHEAFDRELGEFLREAKAREPRVPRLRLGVVGIPPIVSDLFAFVDELGAGVVFNEMARQFSMPYRADSILEQYRLYTYPYDVFFRVADIKQECRLRRLDGLIHYVQSFCFRQIQDRVLRERLDLPILTLECDRPGTLDGRSRTRIEAFIEMLA